MPKSLLIVVLLLLVTRVSAQMQVEDRDLKDVLRSVTKDSTEDLSLEVEVGKNYFSFLPVIGYAPANGAVIGGVMNIARLYDPKPTKMSMLMLNVQLTSKQQFIINVRSKIYLLSNKWFLQGDWRILFYAQPTYGLGVNTGEPGSNPFLININGLNTNKSPLAQDMRFNYLRIYEDVVRQVGKSNWYLGAGIAVDKHYNIRDEMLQTDSTQENFFITDHYAYSVSERFDPSGYTTTGFNFNVLNDTRDDVANAYSGYLFSVRYRVNVKTRSTQPSTMLAYDFRYFIGLSKSKPRHVLALWTIGQFVTSGRVPYLALPSIGWDTYNRTGRGYIQGRFRGLSMAYGEVEYRFPVSSNGLFGGVLFVNGTAAESTYRELFYKVAPGGGFGIRLKMDKRSRINLGADFAYGADNSGGIYLNLQETF